MTKISGISTSVGIGAVTGDAVMEVEKNDGTSAKSTASVLGVASGTSFPGSPTTGDRFYRSDRHIEYYYDGTRWLSTQIFSVNAPDRSATVSASTDYIVPHPGRARGYDIYISNFTVLIEVTSATTGTNYFTARLASYEDSTATVTNLGSGLTSQSATQNAWVVYNESISSVVAQTEEMMMMRFTRAGSGVARLAGAFEYRLVG